MQVLVDKDGLQRHPRPQRNVIPYYSRELDNLEKKKETCDFFHNKSAPWHIPPEIIDQ
jgi:hypothetical protein